MNNVVLCHALVRASSTCFCAVQDAWHLCMACTVPAAASYPSDLHMNLMFGVCRAVWSCCTRCDQWQGCSGGHQASPCSQWQHNNGSQQTEGPPAAGPPTPGAKASKAAEARQDPLNPPTPHPRSRFNSGPCQWRPTSSGPCSRPCSFSCSCCRPSCVD